MGSHLCDHYVKKNYRVICLDNLATGSRENIKHLLPKKNFSFLRQSVTKPLSLKVDYIFHLASPASPAHYQKDPIATFEANVFGAKNLLELAKKNKAMLLLASTSEVYGDPLEHPQTEKYWGNVNPVGIRSCYDESKRAAETLCMDYSRKFGVNAKIVRIFNTYGPRMGAKDGRVVSNFIVQALSGKPLTIYGSGKQTRSFQYIGDLIQGITAMAESKKFTGPVNLGNPVEFTMLELAKKVLSLTGSKSKLAYKPLPQDDPKQRRPDISLAKSKLNWQPKVGLNQGLEHAINYFRQVV